MKFNFCLDTYFHNCNFTNQIPDMYESCSRSHKILPFEFRIVVEEVDQQCQHMHFRQIEQRIQHKDPILRQLQILVRIQLRYLSAKI